MRETEVNDTRASTSTSDDLFQKLKVPTARFVDNKRKILEKTLSANQREQVSLNLAKDEVQLKQKLIDGLMEATKECNKALESILQSMIAVGKSIGDGLALLATALSAVQTQQTPEADECFLTMAISIHYVYRDHHDFNVKNCKFAEVTKHRRIGHKCSVFSRNFPVN